MFDIEVRVLIQGSLTGTDDAGRSMMADIALHADHANLGDLKALVAEAQRRAEAAVKA